MNENRFIVIYRQEPSIGILVDISEEKDFIAFLFRTLLIEEFGSKRVMAERLEIPLRTLQENIQCLDKAKGGTIAFERLILYCVQNHMDICRLYLRYVQSKEAV